MQRPILHTKGNPLWNPHLHREVKVLPVPDKKQFIHLVAPTSWSAVVRVSRPAPQLHALDFAAVAIVP